MSLIKRHFPMIALVAALAFAANAAGVSAQDGKPAAPSAEAKAPVELQHVNFDSLDGKTKLIAHLFRPPGDAPRPAVVTMHGCSGLLAKNGRFFPLHRAWAGNS